MKKTLPHIHTLVPLVILAFVSLIQMGCTCSSRDRGNYGENAVERYINECSSYQAGSCYVEAGQSMQDVVLQNNPTLEQLENESGLGGSKLIGEMSADASGMNRSRPTTRREIPIGTPEDLKLRAPQDPDNIIIGILEDDLSVNVEPIKSCSLLQGLIDIFSGEAISPMRTVIHITNITTTEKRVVIEQGQMIEAEDENVQNIVVCKSVEVYIPAGSTTTVTTECMCAAHYREGPVGSRAKLTPFILNASPSVFANQQGVWDYIAGIRINPNPHSSSLSYRGANRSRNNTRVRGSHRRQGGENGADNRRVRGERRRGRNQSNYKTNEDDNYVTFYIWKAGDPTPNGGTSDCGHAFVRIPTVGTWGFSADTSQVEDEWDLIRCPGQISDHTSMIAYATDSCRIKVSRRQISAMTRKLRELQRETPHYGLGWSDCTSFVMDIADAGRIKYGRRFGTQFPIEFMEKLQTHNSQQCKIKR